MGDLSEDIGQQDTVEPSRPASSRANAVASVDERTIQLYAKSMDAALNGISIAEASVQMPLIYVNKGFQDITGYSKAEMLGRNCRFLQGAETDPEQVAKIHVALSAGQSIRTTLRNYRKDGQTFWNDLSLSPIRDDDGNVTHFIGIQHDITEVMNQKESLAKRSAEINSLLESTSDGIYGLDATGNCSFINSSGNRMLGYDRGDELLGQSMHELIHHDHGDGIYYSREDCAICQVLLRGHSVRVDDEAFWRKDGTALAVEYTTDPIIIDGVVTGSVVTFRDIEEKRTHARMIEQARKSAESANLAKSEFLANMSHEIRTPLTAVMGFVDILQTEIVDSDHRRHLSTIKRNVYYLLDIINDILDLSKIEADRLDNSRHPVNLIKVLNDLNSVFAMRAQEQGLSFAVSFQTPIPPVISSHTTQLRQILLNLLANATKFTESGRVDLIVRINEEMLEFQVRDTGIGMTADTQAIIFDAFSRGKDVPSRIGGTGLGLNISRRLAERLDGTLTVSSRITEGSNFVLSLPLQETDRSTFVTPTLQLSEHIEPSSGEDGPQPLQGTRILVVDDQPDILQFGTAVFERAGSHVVQAADGPSALDAIATAESPFDLILLDMQLPFVSGFEIVRTLREGGDQTAIIAMTAEVMKGERERCLDAGCTDFLAKPVERRALLEAAGRALLADQPSSAIRVLVVEDHIDAAAALAAYLEGVGFQLRVAHSGVEARALFHGFSPHVCLIDQNLPDETGTELRRSLERDANTGQTIYIVTSGTTGDSENQAFLTSGFEVVFPKPIDLAGLTEFIQSRISSGHASDEKSVQ